MRLKPVELFLALGLAATTVACGQKENPTGGDPQKNTITAPAPQTSDGGEGGEDGGDQKQDSQQDEGSEGGEGGEGGEGT
jgi:hypothetical protein